jgi:multimeric flavodoxin WrbA
MKSSQKNKAGIFKDLKINDRFSTSIESDGFIIYQKISTQFAEIVETGGKYQSHLIGSRKYFYGQNMIFHP